MVFIKYTTAVAGQLLLTFQLIFLKSTSDVRSLWWWCCVNLPEDVLSETRVRYMKWMMQILPNTSLKRTFNPNLILSVPLITLQVLGISAMMMVFSRTPAGWAHFGAECGKFGSISYFMKELNFY